MDFQQACKQAFIIAVLACLSCQAYADDSNNPCGGSIIALVDRPSIGDSPCVISNKHAMLEAGVELQKLYYQGSAYNWPQAEFRLGLPENTELVLVLPNYIHQTIRPTSGLTAAVAGIKHELGHTSQTVSTVEMLVTLPTGSYAYGSQGMGAALNGIYSQNLSKLFNVTLMVGVSTQTLPGYNGGQTYNSFNPDLIFTYSPNDNINFYLELYGQTKTAPNQASGYNSDGGVIYLLLKNLTVDLEVGQRLSGTLTGFNHYIGAGFALLL